MTSYTGQQIQQKTDNLKERSRKINNVIQNTESLLIILLDNCRHVRRKLRRIEVICAAFVCKSNDLFQSTLIFWNEEYWFLKSC